MEKKYLQSTGFLSLVPREHTSDVPISNHKEDMSMERERFPVPFSSFTMALFDKIETKVRNMNCLNSEF